MATVGKYTVVKLLGGELRQYNAGDRIQVQVSALQGISRRALDLRLPFEAFIPIWHEQERMVFAAQGLPSPWPALSPAYAAWKANHYPGKTILRRTDRLYESLTEHTGDSIAQGRPRTLRLGTRVPWWIHHQLGTGRMPRRPPVVMLPQTFRRLARMTIAWVNRGQLT